MSRAGPPCTRGTRWFTLGPKGWVPGRLMSIARPQMPHWLDRASTWARTLRHGRELRTGLGTLHRFHEIGTTLGQIPALTTGHVG